MRASQTNCKRCPQTERPSNDPVIIYRDANDTDIQLHVLDKPETRGGFACLRR
jgi:hypothetical protein